MSTYKPSIAELQRLLESSDSPMAAVHAATPTLLEIAAAALAWQDSMSRAQLARCWTLRPSDGEAEPTGALIAALAKVRP